jgi:hypothetical protein
MEAQFEILVSMYIESATPEPAFAQAALTKGGEIGLSEQQTYLVLEGLEDGRYIQVGRVSGSGSGEINYYPVRRLTALGTDTAVQYARTIDGH